jgi:hypothetical protein
MNALERLRLLTAPFPGVEEADHRGMPSFRVAKRIFATVLDKGHVRVMADEASILAAVASDPSSCAAFYWGKRLACVVVDVGQAKPELLSELLEEAWLRKAPATLARRWAESGGR